MNLSPHHLRALIFVGLAAVASGCASAGHSFNYGASTNLNLGSLQYADAQTVFNAKPTAVEDHSTADGKFQIQRYAYAFADMGSARARVVIVEFRNGTLNGFVFVSSFNGEATPIPLDKVSQIKNHNSTRADVANILGKPNGKALCPTMLQDFKDKCDKGAEIWMWQELSSVSTFGAAYGGQRPTVKTIFVSFDKDGLVTDTVTASVASQ